VGGYTGLMLALGASSPSLSTIRPAAHIFSDERKSHSPDQGPSFLSSRSHRCMLGDDSTCWPPLSTSCSFVAWRSLVDIAVLLTTLFAGIWIRNRISTDFAYLQGFRLR